MASLLQIMGVFAKIGTFTIGGGYAMIPVIEREMKDRGWIDEEEIEDVVVLAQSAPGLLAVNMAIFAGYKIRGLKGSLAATFGAVLPSFAIILLIAIAFTSFKDNVFIQKFFQGLRPVAIALILVPAVNMARNGCIKWLLWLLMLFALVLLAYLKVSAIWVIVCVLIVSVAVASAAEGRKKKC